MLEVMITTNINKVKACKSLKDQQKETDPDKRSKIPEKGEGDKESAKRPPGQLVVPLGTAGGGRGKDQKGRGRAAARDDFRMARGGSGSVDKRGAYRGRGIYTRKPDRDVDSFGTRIIKNTSDSGPALARQSGDSKSKTDLGSMVPEDCRISKVLRRLFREEDSDKFIQLCVQLQDALSVPENLQYIRRCMENILDALLDLLHSGPGSCAKSQVAAAIGHVGYVLDSEFRRFVDWVFPKYASERNTDVKCLLLEALRQTLLLEAECPKLKAFSVTLMMKMQHILENTDLPDLFVASVEVIMQLSSLYPDTLTDYFRDLVDILVGWLIDSSQTAKMTDYAARSLQRLAPYWIQELNFSITFLGQFLEDMEIYGDDFVKSVSPEKDNSHIDSKSSSPDDYLFKVEAFIKSFNTVTKALGDHMSPSNSSQVTWAFLGDCLSKMLTTVKSVLDVRFNEDLIISANECIWLLLSHLQTKTTPGHDLLYAMFDFLLSKIDNMCNITVCSVLHVIAKTVKEVSANLPLELVQKLLSPESCVTKLRFSPSKSVQKATLGLYHALLNLKNIPLLQEAYRYVLGDLEVAYCQIVPGVELLCQTNPFADVMYSKTEADLVVLFLLAALSDLANASNSIIGMWALKPSMLELLALKMKPQEVRKHAGLQYTILYLLFSHCSKSNNFVSSSGLVQMGAAGRRSRMLPSLPSLNTDVPVSSPTSSNLSNILILLKETLMDNCSLEVDLLLLSWVRELLTQGSAYLSTMAETPELQSVLSAVVSKGHSALKKPSISLSVCGTLQLVFSFQNIAWKTTFLASVTELCLLLINSTYADVASGYSHLLSVLPWNVTLPILATMNFAIHIQNPDGSVPQKIHWAHSSHLSKNEVGVMGQQEFRQFMWYLIHGEEEEPSWLLDIFSQSWPLDLLNTYICDTEGASDSCKSAANIHKDLSGIAKYCQPVLLQWAAWDAAQYCVTSKLRTPLGKPQETFTKIEGAIKALAREADDCESWDVIRVRVLVDFIEQLEKVIYNATDGTALAIEPPPKQVRNFFHTNRSTCVEWLNRVRLAVIAVALRAGQAATAIRQGHSLLQHLQETNNTQSLEFERAALYVGCALSRLQEWESIQGLYVWSRNDCGRKIPLLKGLVEQAAGRLEHAVDFFSHILNQDEETDLAGGDCDVRMREVADDQLSECHRILQDWEKLAQWKLDEKNTYPTNGGMLLLSSLKTNQVQGFAEYEALSYEAAARLMNWNSETANILIHQQRSWNTMKMLRTMHGNLTSIAVALAGENFVPIDDDVKMKWSQYVEQSQSDAHLLLKEGMRNPTSELLLEATVAEYAATGLADLLHVHHSETGPLMLPLASEDHNIKNISCGILSNALWWSEFLQHMGVQHHTTTVSELRVATARKARKDKNLGFAVRLLAKELCVPVKSSLEELAKIEMNDHSLSTPHHLKSLTEVAKVLYAAEKKDLAVLVVAHGAQSIRNSENSAMQERGSRLLLTLAKWLQSEPTLASSGDNGNALNLLLDHDLAGGADLLDIQNCSLLTQNGVQVIPTADTTVGRLLRLAVVQCPQLAKSWAHFANWCYRWGRRAVDVTSEIGGQLSSADKACVQAMLPQDSSPSDLESVLNILGQTRAVADEEDIDLDSTNTSEMMEFQLRTVNALHYASSETLAGLVGVWREAQQRVYSCYQLSAIAYFKFLQLCGQEESCVEDCSTITASLRLLRLVVKHALELQSVLEAGLAGTPTAPWKAIIPQLFSRMGHPEAYVRQRVAELLCRLAEDAPHLITFPAVVGAASEGARLRHMPMPGTARLFGTFLSPDGEVESLEEVEDEDDEDDDEEEEEDEENSGSGQVVLKNCFLAMVDTLSKQAPESISQVQQFVCELRRITLLWDELWLGTLTQNQTEINQRVSQLNAEIARVDQNGSLSPVVKEKLIAEKYRIIVKPLLFIFEQLHAITSVTPETPHERWFQDRHGKLIETILLAMKEPKDCKRAEEWHGPLKSLQTRLGQRTNKRTAHTLRMEDISPTLAAMKNTCIAMPGVTSEKGCIITISSVHNHVYILPTKTKPKKLMFFGSDGKTYNYLFKGLEDLHLDERIMQLLSIANTMLKTPGLEDTYRARHYSVIPLGPRSGLISWVDNVTPLFGLYKRWQQREALAQAAKNGLTPMQVKRPSELFYQKLTPRLKEKGVSLESRKEWPLPVLREVLQELMSETPSQLLAKELWCHSVNTGAWYKTLQTYSHSVAVMSVIGYIIGLGDRHLDNVLVDLSTGEVVHIDYNVCFEKGKTLRVPEKVPFRMTPNIQAALGVTGVEGTFRLTCEHVLKVLKKGRETLLTLLEAFVYDPLIDWTTGNEAGYAGAVYGGGQAITLESKQSHKELEREVTRTMFSIRVIEIRADWLKNRDEVIASLEEIITLIGRWMQSWTDMQTIQDQLQDCHSLLALVKEAEVQVPNRTHSLYTLPVRYTGHRQARDAQEVARTLLREKQHECDQLIQQYTNAVTCLHSPQLSSLSAPVDKEGYMVFDLVKEFLQNAGQGQMVFQCEQWENDMGAFALKQIQIMRGCVDLLNQYSAVCGLFPLSYINKHRIVCYQRWTGALLKDLSALTCQDVVGEFGAILPPAVNGRTPHRQQVINFAFGLQAALAEANIRLQKTYSLLRGENGIDIGARLENACVEADAALNKLRMGDPCVNAVLECVAVTALVALNKRFLMMEAASASAGDCLVDLTSREGEWFLDDMCLIGGMMVKISSLIQAPTPDALQCITLVHKLFCALQDLNTNFASIILPEAVVALQTQNPSVEAMIADLNVVINSAPLPLQELVDRLDVHLSCLAIGVDSPHHDVHPIVSELREKFEFLLQNPTSNESNCSDGSMSAGQMLLMGFNGLFEKLYLDGHQLAPKLSSINSNIPPCWRNLDHIREAKTFSGKMLDERTRPVLEDIFLLKRLQTMQELFWLCSAAGRCYRGDPPEQGDPPPPILVDEDRLMKPVRRFTADFVSRMLLGVVTHTLAVAVCKLLLRMGLNVTGEVEQRDIGAESKVPLEELCHKAVERCCGVRSAMLAQVSSHVSTLEACWRRREAHNTLSTLINQQTASVQRLQLAVTAHYWLHDVVLQNVQGIPPPPFNRATFLRDIQRAQEALLMLQPRITEFHERQRSLVSSVEQRLKWAAGANPALNEVLSAFACAVEALQERVQGEQGLANLMISTCSSIVHHEVMRSSCPAGMQQDTAFLQLVDQCEQSCLLACKTGDVLSSAEESLLRMVPLEGQVDKAWIQRAEVAISDNVKMLQQKMVAAQEMVFTSQESIKAQVSVLRTHLGAHNRLMGDVRSLIKSMAKSEDGAFAGLADYLTRYRAYSEKLSSLTRQLTSSDDLVHSQAESILGQVQLLIDNTSAIYEDMLCFSTPLGVDETVETVALGKPRRPALVRQSSVCLSPKKGIPCSEKELPRDPQTGKAVQERNAYAMSVWRRVRMKLEGRDPDSARRSTVAEQVDFILNEATNLDNLALLYEGWTPWV